MLYDPDIITLDQLDNVTLNKLIGNTPVFLVASAISGYAKTSLPSGQIIVRNLFNYIFSEYRKEEYIWLEKLFNNLPFEAVNECFPYPQRIPGILQKQFLSVVPNPLHEALAIKLRNREIACLITPNYDMAFDIALERSEITKLYSTECCREYNSSLNDNPVYFKIHGSAEYPASLIFSLEQEKRLCIEKEKSLQRILKNRCLVLMGYSGRDFDICPLLSKKDVFNYKKIVWLRHPLANPYPFEKQLLSSNPGNIVVKGDIRSFIEKMSDIKIETEYLPEIFDAQNLFGLTEEERVKWQLAILERLNCPSVGELTIKNNLHCLSAEVVYKYQLGFLYWKGQAKAGVKKSLQLKTLLEPTSKEYQFNMESIAATYMARGCLLDLSKSYLAMCNAKINAHKLFPKEKDIHSRILHREIVYWGVVEKTYFFLYPFTWILRVAKARKLVKSLRDVSWPQKQGILLAVNRINSRWIKIPDDVEHILEPVKGFNNLGSPGHEIVGYMDSLYRQQAFDKEEFDTLLEIAENLGAKVMIWKLYRAAAITSKLSSLERKEYFKLWKKYEAECDYGVVFKLRNSIQYYLKYIQFIIKTNESLL